MSTLVHTIFVINQVGASDSEMHGAVEAINIQQTRDFASIWGRHSTLSYDGTENIPDGAYPAYIQNDIGAPGAGGFHDKDENGRPFIRVLYTPGGEWIVALAHEVAEETTDPTGNRLIDVTVNLPIPQAPSIQAPIKLLLESADPPEAISYPINGVPVTDFIVPEYYDATIQPGFKYSFLGTITAPRTIAPGGYISWINPDGTWSQLTWFDPSTPTPVLAGPFNWTSKPGQSLREMVDEQVRQIKAAN